MQAFERDSLIVGGIVLGQNWIGLRLSAAFKWTPPDDTERPFIPDAESISVVDLGANKFSVSVSIIELRFIGP